ncbi:MAG: tetratricopeptide repeat protein, partial [Planctomycetota bacterium]|nr:tetratricopeptide repeat protein [Planctomycetota bacterium]
ADGDYVEAEGFFKQALEIDPDSHAARKNLAAAVRQRKLAEKAKKSDRLPNKETPSCREKPSSLF